MATAKDREKWGKELKKAIRRRIGDDPWCESCGTHEPPIDIAHADKRRFIQDRETYFEAALLCRREHTGLDEGEGEDPHGRMREFVREIRERNGGWE